MVVCWSWSSHWIPSDLFHHHSLHTWKVRLNLQRTTQVHLRIEYPPMAWWTHGNEPLIIRSDTCSNPYESTQWLRLSTANSFIHAKLGGGFHQEVNLRSSSAFLYCSTKQDLFQDTLTSHHWRSRSDNCLSKAWESLSGRSLSGNARGRDGFRNFRFAPQGQGSWLTRFFQSDLETLIFGTNRKFWYPLLITWPWTFQEIPQMDLPSKHLNNPPLVIL